MPYPLRAAGALVLALAAIVMLVTPACQPESNEPELGSHSEIKQAVTTYNVGPTRTHQTLQQVAPLLLPGDIVLVDYGTYSTPVKFTKPGTATSPITIRGCLPGMFNCNANASGLRPVIKAGVNVTGQQFMVHFQALDYGNHATGGHYYVFENFEIDLERDQGNANFNGSTGNSAAVRHEADGIRLSNVYIHDCPAHGVVGHDEGSGSLTIEYSEVGNCGDSDSRHALYPTTAESAYPDAVFRLQHSYLHHSLGGNMVKSRARRNEIYYNWIENAYYRELELIGPDWRETAEPRNSDVVGNVVLKTVNPSGSGFANVRIGHDQVPDGNILGSKGRYRFVNNTFIMPAAGGAPAIQSFQRLESVEMHNNVFYRTGGGALTILHESSPTIWTLGSRRVGGTYNWVPAANTIGPTPAEWTNTRSGSDPGFASPATSDYRPGAASALINMGSPSAPSTPNVTAIPSALWPPIAVPPLHAPAMSATGRANVGTIDIGAYENGTGTTCSYALNPTSASFASAGGNGSFSVTAPAGCTWNATSTMPSWLTITSGGSGSGNGTVSYSVASNGGTARGGAVTVAQLSHTVSQAGTGSGGGGTVDVYRNQAASEVSFVGGSAGVQASIAAEGVGGSNCIKHTNLQIWDGTKRLVLPTPIDITNVQATDKLRISLDVSAGRSSNIHVFFNNDFQTVLITPVLDQTAGFQTFEIVIGATMRARLGNSVNDIYFKAGSGFPDSGTLKVDDIQFVTATGGSEGGGNPPPSGSLADVYIDQTNVTFDGGSAGVLAAIALTEGVSGSPAVKHSNLQIWDATKRLQLPTAVNISNVLATDKLRISLDVSAGRASTIHVYFNGDWQTFLVTPVLDQLPGYQTFDIEIGSTMRTRMGNTVNGIYFKAGSGFPDSGTLWVDNIKFVRP
jgi:hypothetical protein